MKLKYQSLDPSPAKRDSRVWAGMSLAIACFNVTFVLAVRSAALDAAARPSIYYLWIGLNLVSYLAYALALVGATLAIVGLCVRRRPILWMVIAIVWQAVLVACTVHFNSVARGRFTFG